MLLSLVRKSHIESYLSNQRLLHTSIQKNRDYVESKASVHKQLQTMVADERRGLFRVLDIGKPSNFRDKRERRSDRKVIRAGPREKLMKPTQDWMSVWPAPRTFHPASVPLPVRQGFPKPKEKVTPHKYANAELMKIPNFLHLTPPVIKRQCELLKKYCTKWPEELNSPERLISSFPIVEMTSDFLNSSSSIRDNRSRIVTIKYDLECLFLDYASKDKFIRLIGETRYNLADNTVTISSDRCPYRKQNRDYLDYLLKALYYESKKREKWEVKYDSDYEEFTWSSSKLLSKEFIKKEGESVDVKDYERSLERLLNEGEDVATLSNYKQSVLKLLGINNNTPVHAEIIN